MKSREKPKLGEPFNPYGIDKFAPAYDCVLKSRLSDSEKLLLTKLFQYGGKNGKVFPKRKSLADDLGWGLSKLDKVVRSLKDQALIRTVKTGSQSSSEYTFLHHEIYEQSYQDAVTTRPESKEITLRPETIELIKYWNSFENLTTHSLEGKQTQTVRDLDDAIHRLLKKTFYDDHKDVPKAAKRVLTMERIKLGIERIDIASGPDYATATRQRMTFMKFIFNPRARLGTGRERYRYRYPLLYFADTDPIPLSEKPTRKKTEYQGLVDKVLERIAGNRLMSDRDYNKAVEYVEKAVAMISKARLSGSGSDSEIKSRLPDLIYDSMLECGKGVGINQLGLAVHHLEELMRRKLIIQ